MIQRKHHFQQCLPGNFKRHAAALPWPTHLDPNIKELEQIRKERSKKKEYISIPTPSHWNKEAIHHHVRMKDVERDSQKKTDRRKGIGEKEDWFGLVFSSSQERTMYKA